MSDTEPLPSEPDDDANSAYSIKRLNRVMKAKEIKDSCPICNTNFWHNASNEKFKHYIPTISINTGINVIVLVCDNCAFVRMHSTIILESIDKEISQKNVSNESEAS
jgi:hypothetical protein